MSDLQPYATILANLAIPLPKECISSYQRQGKTIRYVKVPVIEMVLDKYAPGWTSTPPEVYEVCGHLLVKVSLTIRAQDGEFTQGALGWDEKIEDDSFGGPIPRAYATAFRRVARLFGFERRLWEGDDQAMGHLLAFWRQGQDIAPDPVAHLQAAGQGQYEPSTPDTAVATPITLRPQVCRVTPPAVAHYRETKPSPPPVKLAPGWTPPDEPSMDWTVCYNDLLDACKAVKAADFDPVLLTKWLKKTYGVDHGTGRPIAHWTERDMTPLELQDATRRVVTRDFDARHLRALQGALPLEPEPALTQEGA